MSNYIFRHILIHVSTLFLSVKHILKLFLCVVNYGEIIINPSYIKLIAYKFSRIISLWLLYFDIKTSSVVHLLKEITFFSNSY